MKTLEEVRRHFEGFKIAKCLVSEKEFNLDDADERGIHFDMTAYWIVNRKTLEASMLYSVVSDRFAEIVTENIFKGSELQFRFFGDKVWNDVNSNKEYRLKPNNSAEIKALEKQIEELKNKLNEIR